LLNNGIFYKTELKQEPEVGLVAVVLDNLVITQLGLSLVVKYAHLTQVRQTEEQK
jgi:hypothetical protein